MDQAQRTWGCLIYRQDAALPSPDYVSSGSYTLAWSTVDDSINPTRSVPPGPTTDCTLKVLDADTGKVILEKTSIASRGQLEVSVKGRHRVLLTNVGKGMIWQLWYGAEPERSPAANLPEPDPNVDLRIYGNRVRMSLVYQREDLKTLELQRPDPTHYGAKLAAIERKQKRLAEADPSKRAEYAALLDELMPGVLGGVLYPKPTNPDTVPPSEAPAPSPSGPKPESHVIGGGDGGKVPSATYESKTPYILHFRLSSWSYLPPVRMKNGVQIQPPRQMSAFVDIRVVDAESGKTIVTTRIPPYGTDNAPYEDTLKVPVAGKHYVQMGTSNHSGKWYLWREENREATAKLAADLVASIPELAAKLTGELQSRRAMLDRNSVNWRTDDAELARKIQLIELARGKAASVDEFRKLVAELVPGLEVGTISATPPPIPAIRPAPGGAPQLPPGMERTGKR
ncbi:hypothetical protein llg_36560 [Luteolibacter sp. LG18]|nr:hypothetical protein llg_36560 [Luteolibacter sp. LG18]